MSESQKPVVAGRGGRSLAASLKLALAAAIAVGSTASGAKGQARTAAPPAVAAPGAPAGAQGLDALSEETVMNELAGRGINSLLTRLFDEKKVPQGDRDAFKALQALRELGAAPAMSNARRIYLLRQSVDGLDKLVPKLNDFNVLNNYAATLIAKGIEPDIDTLDYWGDNSSTQARIRPAAKVAIQMLKKVADTASAELPKVANLIRNANDTARIEQYGKLEAQANQAKYVGALSAYYEVVSIDVSGNNKAGWDERKKIADEAIKFLSDFDSPDSGIGPMVKMRIAKLQMAKGDYDSAAKNFQLIIDKKVIVEKKPVAMDPAPTDFQQNDAKYFMAVSQVLAKKPADAEKTANNLEAWQKSTLIPGIVEAKPREDAQKMVGAQMTMLRYRIASAKAEAAPAGPQRDNLNKAADAILAKMGVDYPQFQSLITEMLVTRLPDNADLKQQPMSVLQALITRADGERNKPEGATYDKKVLLRGLEAARVMVAKPAGSASPEQVETAKLLIPLFMQKEGQLVDAANGFLDYGTDKLYLGKPNAGLAVDQAAYIAFTQYQKSPQDPAIKKLYERALEVAANPPFSRKEAIYPYANWLRMMNSPEKAIAFYKKVPKGDRNEFNARYFEVVCVKSLLDQAKDPALRTQRMRELSALINQFIPLAQAQITATPPEKPEVATYKFRMMYCIAEGAELALAQKQPKQAITLLEGYEDKIKGVANEEALKNKAMFIRATSLINDNQIDKAIAQVQQLAANPATQDFAIGMVGELLNRLNAMFDTAKAASEAEQMGMIAANKAKLTIFLVNWAETHKDPKIKAKVPEFKLYDANVKREAGQLLPAGPEKTKVLQDALTVYKGLKALPEMKDNSGIDFGIATSEYELGNFEGASSAFGTLIRDGRLGGAVINKPDAASGGVIVEDNPVFWEANLKWIRSNLEISKKPGYPDATKIKDGAERALRDLFITYKERTGGEKWTAEWVSLRKEVLPTWEPGVTTTQPTAPATLPGDAAAPATAPTTPGQ